MKKISFMLFALTAFVFLKSKKFLIKCLIFTPFLLVGGGVVFDKIYDSRIMSLEFSGHLWYRLQALQDFASLGLFDLVFGIGLSEFYSLWESGQFHNPHMTVISMISSYGFIFGSMFYLFSLLLPVLIVKESRLSEVSRYGRVLKYYFPSFIFLSLLFYDYTRSFFYFLLMGLALVVLLQVRAESVGPIRPGLK